MSGYDFYTRQLDLTPRTYKRAGPFTESVKTVSEALAFCERRGLDPAKVSLGHNYVTWESEETSEEVLERVERAETNLRKHVEWVKATYREYKDRGLFDG